MALVRLASRAVIGAFDQVASIDRIVPELDRLGVRATEVSILAKPDALRAEGPPPRRGGPFAFLGRRADWRAAIQPLDRPDVGALAGMGALASVLRDSPSTSPAGALVMQGIPQRDAVIYADLLEEGKILLLVGVADRTMGERVRSLLNQHGGHYVTYYAGRPYGTAFHGSGPGLR